MERRKHLIRYLVGAALLLIVAAFILTVFRLLGRTEMEDLYLGEDAGWRYELLSDGRVRPYEPEIGEYGYAPLPEGIEAVRITRVMTEELSDAQLSWVRWQDGIEVFLDGEPIFSDFPDLARDGSGFVAPAAARAAGEGVSFRATAPVPPELAIEEQDLCVLLLNLLDNALPAASGCPAGHRNVHIGIRVNQGYLTIPCKNTYVGPLPPDENGHLRTTKQDSSEHGFGLLQIRKTAELIQAASAYGDPPVPGQKDLMAGYVPDLRQIDHEAPMTATEFLRRELFLHLPRAQPEKMLVPFRNDIGSVIAPFEIQNIPQLKNDSPTA